MFFMIVDEAYRRERIIGMFYIEKKKNMSYTNYINDEKVTIVQGVGGIRMCCESWMKRVPKGGTTRKYATTQVKTENPETDVMVFPSETPGRGKYCGKKID